MKYIAILTVLLLIASLIGVGYLYLTSNVTVEAIGVVAVEASTQPEMFERLRQQVENQSVIGTAFTTQPLQDISNYQFYTYTIRLKNNCFVKADMVEVQVTPMTGDVLQLADESARALPARTTGDLSATILTDVNMHSVRELNISYYMWGVPFTIRTTYGH